MSSCQLIIRDRVAFKIKDYHLKFQPKLKILNWKTFILGAKSTADISGGSRPNRARRLIFAETAQKPRKEMYTLWALVIYSNWIGMTSF